jgi:hypothetical protein
MINPATILTAIPSTLRDPLLDEYKSIVQNFFERRWSPAELSGGKFSEIVYTILDGHAKKLYAAAPAKPANFVGACRALENNTGVSRSFQILIPRLLPALYEIRNNRGVGHAGGDVDPNHMDATAVLSSANWIMAELVRVYHTVSVTEAQAVVDALVEQRVPLIWEVAGAKRVLDPSIGLKNQILALLASSATTPSSTDLLAWTECQDHAYFLRTLRKLHDDRLIEFQQSTSQVYLLPPGSVAISAVLSDRMLSAMTLKVRGRGKKRS